jgi:hypothetical protein
MKGKWKKGLFILAAVLLPLWVFGDPPVYFAKEINGQVVDGETGKSISDVVVVAKWILYWPTLGHGDYGGSMNTIEVVTDREGKYHIPGWGPRPRPPLAYLDARDPELTYFKSGYYPEGLDNELLDDAHRNRSSMRTSQWDGKVVKLSPFKGSNWMDYALRLNSIWDPLSRSIRSCPLMVLALDAETKRIKQTAPNGSSIPFGVFIENFDDADRAFLKEYKK